MKELQTILNRIPKIEKRGEKTILATVIDVQGSGYRLPGAKMLISETGETFGTVSGGCLEADVLERARKVLKDNQPIILTYDTTKAEADSVFSLNMGCNGITRILLEPVTDNDYFSFVTNCYQNRRTGISATIVAGGENKLGARQFFLKDADNPNENVSDIEKLIAAETLSIFAGERSQIKSYEIAGGVIEVFFEIVKPPVNLMIFGAGYDAIPLAEIAKNLGWKITVIDHRAAFANADRFPFADKIIVAQPENLPQKIAIDDETVAVIMTHNYEKDAQILRFLLPLPLKYIGSLGPKRRAEKLLDELNENGENPVQENLNHFYSPIGLDIGAESPEMIALAVIAEIQSVLARRGGGFLRERQGSIYGRQVSAG